MTGKIMPLRERDTSTIQAAADAFLSSPRYANPNTRRGYTGVLDRLLAALGASRPLAEVSGEDLAGLLEQLWGQCAPATWNRNRGAVAAWLSWCAASRLPAPVLPASAERRREHLNATRAVPRPAIDRALSRSDVPLREKTLWRMLYETAARASEVLALNIEDLDLDARRTPIMSKGGDTEWICWGSGTAHLLPRLIRGRQAGPVFLSERRPGPARRPAAQDLCPATGTGPARLRPRPDPVHPAHRVAAAPASPLRSDSPRRARHPAAADHGFLQPPPTAHYAVLRFTESVLEPKFTRR